LRTRYLSHPATLLAVLCLGVAGCGGDDGDDEGSASEGDEAQITAVMEREAELSNAQDGEAYCQLILEQYRNAFGNCADVVQTRFEERGTIERTIESVEVEGESATVVAELKLSTEDNKPTTERTILRKEEGEWRIDSYVRDDP